jgi:hypothetical protein
MISLSNRCLTFVATLLLTSSAASAQQKPQPQPQPQLRGFGVVLLEGSQQAGTSSDLPATATAAIADIKDFLPFKSYRLLDSSWTLGSNAAQEYVSRLQGGTQEFQVSIGSKVDTTSSSIDVKFTLTETGFRKSTLVPFTPKAGAEPANPVNNKKALTWAPVPNGRVLPAPQAETSKDAAGARPRVFELPVLQPFLQAQTNSPTWRALNRNALIDTSFTMRIGETVVVGTSRVGGDKALIVLLTAVPVAKQ